MRAQQRMGAFLDLLADKPAGMQIGEVAIAFGLSQQRAAEVMRMLRKEGGAVCKPNGGAFARWFTPSHAEAYVPPVSKRRQPKPQKPARVQEPAKLSYTVPLELILSRCEEDGECLCWTGPMNNGSPQVILKRRHRQARRIVYEHTRGPLPSGRYPVMKCRNDRCLNGEHMTALTTAQIGRLAASEGKFATPERRLAIAAGRRAVGKLNIEKARAIRESDEPCHVLAARYGIHRSMAARIKRGDAWQETAANASVFNFRPQATTRA